MNDVIGRAAVLLDGEKDSVRSRETNLGDMIADAVLDKAGPTGAAIAIVNGGSIRASIPAGDISLGKVLEVFPYDNYMVVIDLTGAQLIAALENGVSQVEGAARALPAGVRP